MPKPKPKLKQIQIKDDIKNPSNLKLKQTIIEENIRKINTFALMKLESLHCEKFHFISTKKLNYLNPKETNLKYIYIEKNI